jgi:hypothetical protein
MDDPTPAYVIMVGVDDVFGATRPNSSHPQPLARSVSAGASRVA